jgi:hypothetical protein
LYHEPRAGQSLAIGVEYAGYRGEQTPRILTIGDRRLVVAHVQHNPGEERCQTERAERARQARHGSRLPDESLARTEVLVLMLQDACEDAADEVESTL